MAYIGDFADDYATLNTKFTTVAGTGASTVLAGSPILSVYKANGTTQSTAGITLSVDFDSVVGLNNVLIDLSADAFYATGNDYHIVITTGTVDGVSVVGYVVGEFSIENRSNTDGATLATTQGNYAPNKVVPDAAGTAPTAAEIFTAILTTQMTEAYAADTVAPTLAQAIFLVQQSIHQFAITSVTRTVKKLDKSTTAATFTLDDATSPTSTTRAT